MKVLITSGGTRVPIDRVRHIGNMSSGTFGSKIALEALKSGHEVLFLKAEGSKHPLYPDFSNAKFMNEEYFGSICKAYKEYIEDYKYKCNTFSYKDFDSYFSSIESIIKKEKPDVIILAAAVSDYGVSNPVDGKIRSKDSEMNIQLKKLPKIISMVREWAPDSFIIGFKLLVDSTEEELISNSIKSLEENKIDLVVANDLRDIKNNDHKLLLVNKESVVEIKKDSLDENHLAKKIIERIK